ncbi:MAG: hypothetical protein M9950_02680 [Thermomicrobiales bacterium]|nr:hypothetical protein [Thermomicrobiales bacterium]
MTQIIADTLPSAGSRYSAVGTPPGFSVHQCQAPIVERVSLNHLSVCNVGLQIGDRRFHESLWIINGWEKLDIPCVGIPDHLNSGFGAVLDAGLIEQ